MERSGDVSRPVVIAAANFDCCRWQNLPIITGAGHRQMVVLRRHVLVENEVMQQNLRSLTTRSGRRRGAILTTELLLVLPIFLLLLGAIVELTLLVTARNQMANVAHAATRQLCLGRPSDDAVRQQVSQLLGATLSKNASIEITRGQRAGDLANVRLVIPMRNASPDLLWVTGFSVGNRVLVADAPMVGEHDDLTITVAVQP